MSKPIPGLDVPVVDPKTGQMTQAWYEYLQSDQKLALALGHPITNSLSGDVTLNNTANYFDGPSIAQGTVGTWFASGQIVARSTLAGDDIYCKLWDGTTLINSGKMTIPVNNFRVLMSLSGVITAPVGNIRISIRSPNNTAAVVEFNGTGNSKDSTISAFRIA